MARIPNLDDAGSYTPGCTDCHEGHRGLAEWRGVEEVAIEEEYGYLNEGDGGKVKDTVYVNILL